MSTQYRLVFSDIDGAAPVSFTPMDKPVALAEFDRYVTGGEFDVWSGAQRLRVVSEQEWAAIASRAGRPT